MPRTDILRYANASPVKSRLVAWNEFLDLTRATRTRLVEVIELGWIEPVRTSGEEYLFRAADVYRLRKLLRLCADFELPCVGGTIVVDLLERIDCLQTKVRELESLLRK